MPTFLSSNQLRSYYSPSLSTQTQQSYLTGQPRNFYEESTNNILTAGLITGGVLAAGWIPTKSGRVWDKYVASLRGIESYSPGGVLRTFQLSNFFSQFESAVQRGTHVSPSMFRKNVHLTDYIHSLDLLSKARLQREGVTLRGGRLFWGQGEEVALRYASAIRTPLSVWDPLGKSLTTSSWVGAGWTVGLGAKIPSPQHIFTFRQPFFDKPNILNPLIEGLPSQIIGAQTRLGYTGRWAGALGTELVGRFNRLLEMPYGLIEGLPGAKYLPKLAVKSGTGGEMFARMVGKFGIALPAAYMGYQMLDWAVRRSDTLSGTILDEGITAGIATAGVKANIAASRIAQISGLQRYREFQEEVAPGSTSLQKLLAFPLMGALGAGGIAYGAKLVQMTTLQARGMSAHEALTVAELSAREFGTGKNIASRTMRKMALAGPESLYYRSDTLGKAWRRLFEPIVEGGEQLAFRKLGWKLGPTKLAAIGGALAGLALVAPFLPGALIPEKSPEELEDIYSGRQEIAVRRGRWWEAGRSAFEGCLTKQACLILSDGTLENAELIRPGHKLLNKKGRSVRVLKVFTREVNEQVYKFSTSYGQEALTSITGNHQLLVVYCPYYFKLDKTKPQKMWMPSSSIKKDGRYRLFMPYYSPREITKTVDLERISGFTFLNGRWFRPFKDCKGLEADLEILEWGQFSPKSKSRKEKLLYLQEKYNLTYSQIRYRLADIRKHKKQGLLFRKRLVPDNLLPILSLDYSLGLFCGFYAAEGSVTSRRITFALHREEKEYVDTLQDLAKRLFGLKIYTHSTSKNGIEVILYSSLVAKLIKWLVPGLAKEGTKRLNPEIFDAPNGFILGFLEGVIKGDGSIRDNAIRIGMHPCPLLRQMQLLLSRLHIFAALGKITKTQKGYLVQELRIPKTSTYLLNQVIPLKLLKVGEITKLPERQYGYTEVDGGFAISIHSIFQEHYEGIVYDFQVEEDESFLSPGFTLHNSNETYFRPHWFPRMLMRAREKGIWGREEGTISPLEKFWKKEFTYELEQRHYQDRPYPVSSSPFEDVPLIGPILANTLGRVIKPPVYMHEEDWRTEGGVIAPSPRYGQRIATEIGEQPGPPPVTPFGIKGTIGEQVYRMTEMAGLFGFTATSIKEALTGTPDLFDQEMQLESARRIAGYEREYWDLEIGGGLGATEAWRRFFPHRRRQIPLYNPIPNMAAEWLPGAGDKSPDFRTGDPWAKVPEGELRLPGVGYEARYPELEGIEPSKYPLIHRWKILADVAPYSEKYGKHLSMVRAARKRRDWTDYEENLFQQTLEQIKAKKQRKEFREYQYLSPTGGIKRSSEESSSLLTQLNEIKKAGVEEPGLFKKLFGGYWELLSHNAETALDQMTPVSPGAKLVHERTAIESYEREQLYGTQSAFWQHPYTHFVRPSAYLTAASLGFKGVPGHIQSRRELEEYFDVLKYVKYSRLANIARLAEDTKATKEFESKKDETLFGINPYTRNYSSIFRSLPRRERDYFNAFAEAESGEERARILQMVPENEKALYIARWQLAFADDVRRAEKANLLTEDQLSEASEYVEQIYSEAKVEGYPSSKKEMGEFIETRLSDEKYGDWYRRTKILPNIPLPGMDFVGWHPSVDLEDLKLKVVQSLGEDQHDYNLWPSQAQTLMNKPYINEEAVEEVLNPPDLSADEMRSRIDELLMANQMKASIFTRTTWGNGGLVVNIDHQEDYGREK